jgi:hypothetical protein
MTEGSQHHWAARSATSAIRPAKRQILRAHMTMLARRLYQPGSYHRNLATSILQARRRAAGR